MARSEQTVTTAVVLGLLALLMLPQAAQAQTEEDALRFAQRFPATGARMMALGGAGTAGVADYSALYMNPAGLGLFEQSSVSGSFRTLLTLDDATYFLPENLSRSQESDLRSTGLSNLAYIAKAPTQRGSLVFGAAYNHTNTFDRTLRFRGPNSLNSITDSFLPFSDEYEVVEENGVLVPSFFNLVPELAYLGGAIEFLPGEFDLGNYPFYQAVDPATTIEQRGDVLEEGQTQELSFGGATEAVQGVMFGASANVSFGTYAFTSTFEEIDDRDENLPGQYEVFLSETDVLRGFDALEYRERFESDLVGFNVRAGISGAATSALRLGLSLESPTFYRIDEEYSRSLTTFFDEGGSLSEGGDPGDLGSGVFEYELRTPWRLGAGLAFTMGGLTALADAEFVDWTQMRLDASEDELYFDEINTFIREDLQAVANTRLGLEYRFGSLAFRGGFAYQPDPRENAGFEDLSADRSRTYFSAGIGYRFAEQLSVDLGWMQERFDDLYIPYVDVETAPPVVEEEVIRNRFALGVQFFF